MTLVFNNEVANTPFYIYFNVDSASRLRQVLEKPEVYASNGIYIARVHGTFVNFLDFSPAVQRDMMERLSA